MHQVGADLAGIKKFIGPKRENIKICELLNSLSRNYEIRHKLTPQIRSKLKPLDAAFGNHLAMELVDDSIARYIQTRQRGFRALQRGNEFSIIEMALRGFKPVSDATINREMQLLKQAYILRRNEVGEGPAIPKLKETNVRQGFFERAEFEAIVKHLPSDLQDFARFDYLTGWRKGELASLGWNEFNMETRELVLRPEESKNRESRAIRLTGELWEIILRRWKARRFHGPHGEWIISPLVFFRTRGRGILVNGTPIKEFRKAWNDACKAAGLPGRLFHDFRRTAARNMRRAGVPEEVAMKITGHKTSSMFRRYNITDNQDVAEALARTQEYIESLPKERRTPSSEEGEKEGLR
jgi:integrase